MQLQCEARSKEPPEVWTLAERAVTSTGHIADDAIKSAASNGLLQVVCFGACYENIGSHAMVESLCESENAFRVSIVHNKHSYRIHYQCIDTIVTYPDMIYHREG